MALYCFAEGDMPPSDASAAEYHNETFVFLLMGS